MILFSYSDTHTHTYQPEREGEIGLSPFPCDLLLVPVTIGFEQFNLSPKNLQFEMALADVSENLSDLIHCTYTISIYLAAV